MAIEESKDFATYTFDDLMEFFQSPEVRINKMEEKVKEKFFQAKGEGAKTKIKEPNMAEIKEVNIARIISMEKVGVWTKNLIKIFRVLITRNLGMLRPLVNITINKQTMWRRPVKMVGCFWPTQAPMM